MICSGEYAGEDLESERATIEISGAGDVDVRVTDTLDAEISGAGSIVHPGGAQVVRSEISGAGEITAR